MINLIRISSFITSRMVTLFSYMIKSLLSQDLESLSQCGWDHTSLDMFLINSPMSLFFFYGVPFVQHKMGYTLEILCISHFSIVHGVHIIYMCEECVCCVFPLDFPTISINSALNLVYRCWRTLNHMLVMLMTLVIVPETFPLQHWLYILQMESQCIYEGFVSTSLAIISLSIVQ